MERIDLLKKRQESLKNQINENLDLIIGSVVRSPAMMYHSLTTKVEGKTVTRYIRKGLVPKVKIMTDRNKRVRDLHRLRSICFDVTFDILSSRGSLLDEGGKKLPKKKTSAFLHKAHLGSFSAGGHTKKTHCDLLSGYCGFRGSCDTSDKNRHLLDEFFSGIIRNQKSRQGDKRAFRRVGSGAGRGERKHERPSGSQKDERA